jgi:hypothetical protein
VEERRVRSPSAEPLPDQVNGLLVVAVLAAGYAASWSDLLRDGSAALVCVFLALAISLRRVRKHGPAITDRYTDYIVGLPMLAVAIGMLAAAPRQLSAFAWLWRVDLLSVPLFAAGAIALVLGVRAVWNQRLTIAALVLPWLLTLTGFASNVRLAVIAIGASVAVLVAVAIHGSTAAPHSAERSPPKPAGWPAVGATIVLLTSLLAWLANNSLHQLQPLFTSSGQPWVSLNAAAPTISGWTTHHQADYPWITRYLAAEASWERDSYTPANITQAALVVDRISTPQLTSLSRQSLEAFFRLKGDRLTDEESIGLTHGLVAHIVRYVGASRPLPWTAVYWDWPVHSGSGLRYQRIVVSVSGSATVSKASLVEFANLFVNAAVSEAAR